VILHTDNTVLVCAMLVSGILIACYLASKKSIVIDAIAFLLSLFIVACMLVQFKVF